MYSWPRNAYARALALRIWSLFEPAEAFWRFYVDSSDAPRLPVEFTLADGVPVIEITDADPIPRWEWLVGIAERIQKTVERPVYWRSIHPYDGTHVLYQLILADTYLEEDGARPRAAAWEHSHDYGTPIPGLPPIVSPAAPVGPPDRILCPVIRPEVIDGNRLRTYEIDCIDVTSAVLNADMATVCALAHDDLATAKRAFGLDDEVKRVAVARHLLAYFGLRSASEIRAHALAARRARDRNADAG